MHRYSLVLIALLAMSCTRATEPAKPELPDAKVREIAYSQAALARAAATARVGARLGMLSSQNWRAARLVVDTGLHALGWTRQQAIDYMLAHTPQSLESATSEVDRYIIMPGQATAYMLGKLEIVAARRDAQQRLGERFDIKRFHDGVLGDGAVPLSYLRSKLAASF
jgi:uncharacterized protein (DUF885 family)